ARHVQVHVRCLASVNPDLSLDLCALIVQDVSEHHGRAFADEHPPLDRPLASRSAADQRHLAVESPHRCLLRAREVRSTRPPRRKFVAGRSSSCLGSLPRNRTSISRPARTPHAPSRTGIVNVNVDPTPTWLLTQILPPWSSTNFRHRVRPSPVPSCLAVLT